MDSFIKRIGTTILLILLLAGKGDGGISIPVVQGTIDATTWDFNKTLALNGYWAFFDQQLLTPAECFPVHRRYTLFPGTFDESKASHSGQGYATYAVRIRMPHKRPTLALQVPQMYNSYKLWLNGTVIASNGVVGTTPETTTPQWRPKTVTITATADTLVLVLQLANFHHHIGGIREPINIGLADTLHNAAAITQNSSLAHGIFLITEALIFFGVFAFRRPTKKIIIYFALLMLTWGIRAFFSLSYPITVLIPDFNWTLSVKIEYLTLFGLMVWGTLFINKLFNEVSNTLFQNIIVAVNVILILFTLFSPPLLFTRWLSLYLMFIGITVAYITVVVVRAVLQDQVGVWFLITSIALGTLLVAYELAAYQSLFPYNPTVTSVGYTISFLMITVALLLHLGIIKSKTSTRDILTYEDLYEIQPDKKTAR